jgi:MEMO1 family protein
MWEGGIINVIMAVFDRLIPEVRAGIMVTLSEGGRSSMGIKRADFAGTWYPGSRKECLKSMESFARAGFATDKEHSGIGGIVPHAGWRFSGLTAYSVFASIQMKKNPELFFIFGRHQPPGGANAVFLDDGFETPLGVLPVHKEVCERLCEASSLRRENAASRTRDNTVELQLPFIKHLFPGSKVVALAVSADERAVDIGEKCAGIAEDLGVKACFIGSTDLTHYGPNYDFMPKGTGAGAVRWVKEENDRRIVEALLSGDPRRVLGEAEGSRNACCPGGAAAALAAIRETAGIRATGPAEGALVQYTTSYDIHPDASFVGYTGIVY